MGLSDTMRVKNAGELPACGAEVRSLPRKKSGHIMAHFKISSVLAGSSVMTGIVKDSRWCEACHGLRHRQSRSAHKRVVDEAEE